MLWRLALAIVLAAGVALAAPARADEPLDAPPSPEEAVHTARQALEELRYDDALTALEAVGPEAPAPLRVDALAIAATIHLLEGRPALAQPLLEELYARAPAYLLADASLPPSVTKAFDAEAAKRHPRAVTMELRARAGDRHGFELRAGGETARVEVACRGRGGGPFLPLRVRRDGARVRFRLSGEGRAECHVVALDGDGLPLGRLGTATAPIALTPRPPPPPPALPPTPRDETTVADQWWFWTGVLGAAATVGVSIAVAAVAAGPADAPPADVSVALSGAAWSLVRF